MEITCLGQQQCLINKALHRTQLERELRIMSSGNGNGFVTENMVQRHRDGFYPTTRALSARRVQWKTQTNNINWRGELKLVLENYNYIYNMWRTNNRVMKQIYLYLHLAARPLHFIHNNQRIALIVSRSSFKRGIRVLTFSHTYTRGLCRPCVWFVVGLNDVMSGWGKRNPVTTGISVNLHVHNALNVNESHPG